MNNRKRLFSIVIILFLLLVPPNGNSCGPFLPDAVFIYGTHPGAPLPQYARGNLGVVLPGFHYHYLYVAYRYFASRPLRADEIDQMISFWKWRLISPWADSESIPDPVSEWTDARKLVAAPAAQPLQVSTDRTFGQYTNYHNCLPDAFHTAALKLKDLSQKFGPANNDVQEWLHGQDTVFSDCDTQKNIPQLAPENSSAWLKADRQYQIAAAYFYSGNFDQAAQAFDRIAADSSSPWHSIAPYLAARAFIRKGTLKDETPALDQAAMNEAQSRLKKIIADPVLSGIHSASRKLLAYIAIRLDPGERVRQLAPLMTGQHSDPNLRQDLIDYAHGLDSFEGDTHSAAGEEPTADNKAKFKQAMENRFASMADLRKGDELTDWILTFAYATESARQHALSQWQKLHTAPWLVAAISKTAVSSPETSELLQAAERLPATSPAFPTVTYYRLRLLMEKGAGEQARTVLDSLLPQFRKTLTAASLNLFLVLRMDLSRSLDEFLSYAALPVVGSEDDSGYASWSGYCSEKDCPEVFSTKSENKLERRFDRETAMVFNARLPLQQLAQAASDKELPEKLRGELAASTWTRAVMLGQHEIAVSMIPQVAQRYPELKASLESYGAKTSAQDKWHSALFMLLSNPGLRPYVNAGFARDTKVDGIDNFRDNWWCGDMGVGPGVSNFARYDAFTWPRRTTKLDAKHPKDTLPYPPFLSDAQVDAAEAEWKKLSDSGTGPDYLAMKTLDWAKEAADDPRIPEALHLAVRSTRYGCTDKGTTAWSKRAFELLHSQYPKSTWAKQTPYWF